MAVFLNVIFPLPFIPSRQGREKRLFTSSSQFTEEYKIFQNKALQLLGNPNISALQRVKILNLLAMGGAAASSGATGELNNLLRAMDRLDPGLAINANSFPEEASKPQIGSIYTTGGTTTVIYRPKPKMKSKAAGSSDRAGDVERGASPGACGT